MNQEQEINSLIAHFIWVGPPKENNSEILGIISLLTEFSEQICKFYVLDKYINHYENILCKNFPKRVEIVSIQEFAKSSKIVFPKYNDMTSMSLEDAINAVLAASEQHEGMRKIRDYVTICDYMKYAITNLLDDGYIFDINVYFVNKSFDKKYYLPKPELQSSKLGIWHFAKMEEDKDAADVYCIHFKRNNFADEKYSDNYFDSAIDYINLLKEKYKSNELKEFVNNLLLDKARICCFFIFHIKAIADISFDNNSWNPNYSSNTMGKAITSLVQNPLNQAMEYFFTRKDGSEEDGVLYTAFTRLENEEKQEAKGFVFKELLSPNILILENDKLRMIKNYENSHKPSITGEKRKETNIVKIFESHRVNPMDYSLKFSLYEKFITNSYDRKDVEEYSKQLRRDGGGSFRSNFSNKLGNCCRKRKRI